MAHTSVVVNLFLFLDAALNLPQDCFRFVCFSTSLPILLSKAIQSHLICKTVASQILEFNHA
jgi:hypothetical protein